MLRYFKQSWWEWNYVSYSSSKHHIWNFFKWLLVSEIWWNLMWLKHFICYKFICPVFGHKWHNDAHLGPDSGWEDWECTRCGEGHTVTHY